MCLLDNLRFQCKLGNFRFLCLLGNVINKGNTGNVMTKEKNDKIKSTQIGLHSVKNMLGNEQQLSLFSEHKPKEFAEAYGIELKREITKFGIDLTDTQIRVMEGILYGFSKTRYEGNVEPVDKLEDSKEKYPLGNIPESYKYIEKLPRLRVSQAEILEWAGINKNSIAEKERAIEALQYLGTTQFCFYYTRLALDANGVACKGKEGNWKKEEVMAVDTLFTISVVRDKETKILQYYEIIPSPLFLDQRESYFMLVPYNWREEVRKLVGERKASSYTFRFLLFLRYQFELKRRSQREKKPYCIKWSPDEIAIAIKMPESVYKGRKAHANKILEDVYSVAKQLGYLTQYERTGSVDVLWLNEEKYHSPHSLDNLIPHMPDEDNSMQMVQAKELYEFFIQEKRKLDPKYNPPAGGSVQRSSLNHLKEILNARALDEIKDILKWGLTRPYWCNRIGTPSKLRKYLTEALAEMRASKKDGPLKSEERMLSNKDLVLAFIKKLSGKKGVKTKVEAFGKYVEIGDGVHQPVCINYSDNGFQDQFENALRKWKIFDI